MNKENLEQGLTKLLKTFFTKKYDRDFSDLTVVLDEYEDMKIKLLVCCLFLFSCSSHKKVWKPKRAEKLNMRYERCYSW